jgi:D-glycero-alpha-D-manno-heptose 1-phosphate guanylyltransferase
MSIEMNHVLREKLGAGVQPSTAEQEGACAVLLVGGMGTRLRSVLPSIPKPLAPFGTKSFLHLIIQQLRSQSIRQLVMCTGYLGDYIEETFGDGHEWGVAINYSKESDPVGTAGAVKLAERYIPSVPDFLVMNGDSFLETDFRQLIRFHGAHGGLVTIAACQIENASRYGTLQVDKTNRVIGFTEKAGTQAPGLVNGGVYVFNRSILQYIADRPASLERDVFPSVLEHGVYAFEQRGMFIDIGTPEDYLRAQELYTRLYQAAVSKSSS